MQDIKSKASGLSKGSLICGICAIIPFAGWAIGLAAIIMSIIDLVKIKKGSAGKAGIKFDIIGIVLGIVFPWIILLIFAPSQLALIFGTLGTMFSLLGQLIKMKVFHIYP